MVQEQDAHIISMINGVEKQTFYLRQTLNFVMFLLWIVENMFLSFLESKILLWKVNLRIYFPQWQVMSKVSVKPCVFIACGTSVVARMYKYLPLSLH